MPHPKWRNLSIMLVLLAAVYAGWDTHAQDSRLKPGSLPAHWINGTDCNAEPLLQVHTYNEDLFILRQSLCTNLEAPFIYLIFGENRVLMQDTGYFCPSPESVKFAADMSG